MNASDVLAALRVPGFGQWNVYQVGCVSSPLNFASQQQRAFKLTWALDQAKLIEGKKVAVVGAGLAGITAAATCCLRKAEKVTVYDRSHEIMSLQSGAIHRYVHPYIFWWPRDPEIPSPNWNDATTNFPILNWKEGNAHEIRNSVVKDSKELLNAYFKNNRLRYRMGCDVRRIVPIGDAKIELLAEGFESRPVPSRDNQYLPIGAIRNYQRSYDVVIVAVGFGLEAESAGIPFRSYWQQDTLDQPTIRGENPHRWLVTGTGEGGLTDAIRLTLFEVQQKEIAEVLLGRKSPTMNIPRDDWEKKMEALRKNLFMIDESINDKYPDSKQKDQASREIFCEYAKLNHLGEHRDVFDELKSWLEQHERTDTVIYLNGRHPEPYDLGAGAFHRFLIYLLRRHCGLRYRFGTPTVVNSATPNGPHLVQFNVPRSDETRIPVERIEVDQIVVRHGADSAYGSLFGIDAIQDSRQNCNRKQFDKELWSEQLDANWCNTLK